MINFTATYTDQYQLSMALVYFKQGAAEDRAIFDYFFRKSIAGFIPLFSILPSFRNSRISSVRAHG